MTIRDEDRPEPPNEGDARSQLTGFLDWQRATLQWKCSDLTPQQLATPTVPTTSLTLLGIVRHMVEVEQGWFQRFDGSSIVFPYSSKENPDGEFAVGDPSVADQALVDDAWTRWQEAVDAARRVVAATEIDAISAPYKRGERFSLQWILLHMIEEYARHNGHADLLREASDGSVGE